MPFQILCGNCDKTLFSGFTFATKNGGPPNGNGPLSFLEYILRSVNNVCPDCQAKLTMGFDYEVIRIGS